MMIRSQVAEADVTGDHVTCTETEENPRGGRRQLMVDDALSARPTVFITHRKTTFLDPETGPQPLPTLFLFLLVRTKAFSFHNRSSSNFAYTLVTIFSRESRIA